MKYEELSKEVSYALRHAPWEYELEMDEEGWVSIDAIYNMFEPDAGWIYKNPDTYKEKSKH